MEPEKKKPARPPAYPALLLTQNRHRFYFFTIPVDVLFPLCFVASRHEDPVKGFQRVLSEPRAKDIAEYLAAGHGSIPSNIVLSAQEEAHLEYTNRTKTISFERVPLAFLVLDGQHRLWGYQKCAERHRVPVAVYQGLTRAEEAKLFVDINTTQRGVPAALLLDIKELAAIESAQESILRELFDRFANEAESPLAGKLSAAKSLANRISRVTFNRAIAPVLSGSVLRGSDSNARYAVIRNYLNAFDAVLPDKKLLVRSAYFESLFEMFDEVVRMTKSSKGNVKQESIQEVIRPIAGLDLASGRSTKTAISAMMKAALRETVTISQDDI